MGKETAEPVVAKFTLEQLLASKKFKHRKDVLNTVLKSGQSYTIKEVDDRIEKFMKVKG
jgi:hypothetical protein